MSEQTSIEMIKAFHNIKSFLTPEQQNEVISMLKLTEVDIKKRLWGKDNEIEFILMIHLLEWCKSIVGFEEGIASLTNTVASDLYVELNNGEQLIIEIKSTVDDVYKISEKLLNQKIQFASKLNSKLYFAIKSANYWTLFSSDFLVENNRKISLNKDFMKSEFNEIFGDRSFIVPAGLKIISTYSKSAKEHLGFSNHEHGNLIKYKIEFNDTNLLTIGSKFNDKYFMIFVFENLQDMASNQNQQIIKLGEDITKIEESFTDASMMQLSHFIMSPIKHIMSELGAVYDFNKYLTELIDKKSISTANWITRKMILYGLSYLAEKGCPILERRGQHIYNFNDMKIKK